jgi:hypothetical protein
MSAAGYFVMPHVLVIAAAAVLIYCAFRWVRREYDRVDASLRKAERRILGVQSTATPLIFDSATGFYTPLSATRPAP